MTDELKSKEQLLDEISRLRKKLEETEFAHDLHRRIVENEDNAVFIVDTDGTFVFLNATAAAALGGTPESMKGKSQWDVFPKELADRQMESIRHVAATGTIQRYEREHVIGGRRCHYYTSLIPIADPSNGRTSVLGIAKDLTELFETRSALSKSEDTFHRLLEDLPVGVLRASPEGQVISGNPALARMFGCETVEQYLGLPDRESFVDPNQRDQILALLRKNGSINDFEAQVIRRDGSYFWVSLSGHAVTDDDGNLTHFEGIEIDITERKNAEESLRRSGETMRALLNAPGDILLLVDADETILAANQTAARTIGSTVEEIVGRNAYEIFPEKLARLRRGMASQVLATGRPVEFYDEFGGQAFYNRIFPVINDRGAVASLAIAISEITDRREAERALQESERLFRKLAETAPIGIVIHQGDKVAYANPYMRDLVGLVPEEFGEVDFWHCIHPDYVDFAREIGLARQRGEEVPDQYEVKFLARDGRERWGLIRGSSIEYGGKKAAMVLILDITETKRMVSALEESETKYRDLFEHAQVGMFRTDFVDSTILAANDAVAADLGTTVKDLVGSPSTLVWANADDRDRYRVMLKRDGLVRDFEAQIVDRKGRHKWVSLSARLFPEEGYIEGSAIDITERKGMEQALRESEAKYRNLFENAQVGMFRSSLIRDEILEVNRKMADIWGCELAEVTKYDPMEIWSDPGERDRFLSLLRERGTISDFEAAFRRKGGGLQYALVSAKFYPEKGYLEGSAVDITDRKRTEQALEESERMFRVLAETAPVGIYIYQDDRIVYANQRAFSMAGLERAIGIDLRDYLHPEDRDLLDRIAPAIVAGDLMDEQYEMRIILDSGEMRWVLLKGQAILFNGRPAAMGITVDITEQKRSIELIEEAKSQLSAIVENTDDFILLCNENAKPVYFNSAYARVMKEMIGLDMKPGIQPHTLLPDPAERAVWEGFHRRVLSGEKFSVEHHTDIAGGIRRDFRSSFHPIWQEGRVIGFSEYTHETTNRKRAAEALVESEEKFRLLAEQSFDAIFLQDLDGTVIYVSGSCERVTGYTEAEMLGRNPIDLVAGKSKEIVAKAFADLAAGRPMPPTELLGICPDGSERDLEATASPIVKDGKVTGYQAVLRDISDRKRAERKLARAFESQSLHLRQVAGGLAHDVYNDLFPMTASLYKLRQRLQGKDSPDYERDLRIIGLMERAVRRALDLVESVNLYSKMDRIAVEEGADLSGLVLDCLEQNRERLETLKVVVTNRIPENVRIRCSSVPAFHLINNLVINALDALENVERREISFEAEAAGDNIRIRLCDTGAGIKPDDLPRIFDPFFSTKPRSGTGLGLAIVKRVVDLCQGEIEVESSLDKGTRFRILIPGSVGT